MDDVRLLALEQPDEAHEGGRVARAGLARDKVERDASRLDLVGDWAAPGERDDSGLDALGRQRAAGAEDQLLGAADAEVLAEEERLHTPTLDGWADGISTLASAVSRGPMP